MQKGKHLGIFLNIGNRIFNKLKSDKKETETYHRFGKVFHFLFSNEKKRKEESDQTDCYRGYLHIESKNGDHPGGNSVSYIGTIDQPGRLYKGKKARIHKAHHQYGCGGRRLCNGRGTHTGQNPPKPAGGHTFQDSSQPGSGNLLQTIAEDFHSIDENAQRSDELHKLKQTIIHMHVNSFHII